MPDPDRRRPDPDRLLKQVEAEERNTNRGHLKISQILRRERLFG